MTEQEYFLIVWSVGWMEFDCDVDRGLIELILRLIPNTRAYQSGQ